MSNTLPIAVPAHAMVLLDFIYRTDAGKPRPACYGVIYGNNQGKLSKPLTSMTLGDVIDAQADWSKQFGSSAAGAAQFMRATLIDIANEVPTLAGNLLFDANLQDRLAYYLLLRRGYAKFISGRMAVIEFGKALAQEWASFPVLAPCKGQKRSVQRGQSFYAGDGLNKALTSPETVERLLREVLTSAKANPDPIPVPLPKPEIPTPVPAPIPAEKLDPENLDKPLMKSKTVWQWVITTVLMPVLAVFQDWRVQLAIVLIVAGFAVYAIKRRNDLKNVVRGIKEDLGV